MSTTLSFDLGSKEGLAKLNEHLEENSFIEGNNSLTQADVEVLNGLGENNTDAYPSITRWKRNILSYMEGERSGFPKSEVKLELKTGKIEEEKKEEEDDIDLFGEETEEEKKAAEEKKKRDEEAKKKKKKEVVNKSTLVLDIKPFDDETPTEDIERAVRSIKMDGLIWQAAKYVDIAFGLKKLQILAQIEDDKVSADDLEEKILSLENLVQSMDIVAWNKL